MTDKGYRRIYTPAQLLEIELLRAELRERLTCRDSEYEAVVMRHAARKAAVDNSELSS
jgi:hypothetical protein